MTSVVSSTFEVDNKQNLQQHIEQIFEEEKKNISEAEILVIKCVLDLIKTGKVRVAEKQNGKWIVNTWIKQAILLAFKYFKPQPQECDAFDKFSLLPYTGGYRKIPGAIIRDYVHISDGAVIMPSCINIGAYIGSKTMIDMNAVVGSCAQIGANCHISAQVCIGGVLEPAVAMPVIIEDNCFIGAKSAILDGVIVGENSVIAAGTIITSSTRIIDRNSGKTSYGQIQSGSVVVPGSYQSNGCNVNCAVVIKHVTSGIISKTKINEFLRN